jgi:hypothetical protein
MPRVYPCKLLLVCPRPVARPSKDFFRIEHLARIGAMLALWKRPANCKAGPGSSTKGAIMQYCR